MWKNWRGWMATRAQEADYRELSGFVCGVLEAM